MVLASVPQGQRDVKALRNVIRCARLWVIVGVTVCLSFGESVPVRADTALPASLCALISARVFCYDAQTASPSPISDPSQVVIDFAIAPDGNWLVYRDASGVLTMRTVRGGSSTLIDGNAASPAALPLETVSLAWSPDGIEIAYLTASGFRVRYPTPQAPSQTQSQPQPETHVDVTDRAYVDLRWSPGGGRLAAQSDDGRWTFFESHRADQSLHRLSIFAQAADIAWLTDSAVIVAPAVGGLLRIDPGSANAPPLWYIVDEHFIRLNPGADGQIVALHPDPGDVIGSAVSIDANGKWQALGNAKLDSRLDWGPPPATQLLYITSGTPIMVDRATGEEDMLPLKHVDRVVWSAAALPEALGVATDADLYFIAPDAAHMPQLWRLPRDGFPLIPLSQSVLPVTSYTVFGDTIQYVAGSVTATIHPDGSSVLPAIATAGALPRPTLLPSATPLLTETIQRMGWQPGPAVIQKIGKASVASATYLLENAQLSPSGKFAVGLRGTQLVILDWTSGKEVAIQGVQSATSIRWQG